MIELHERGYAHSIEVWQENKLVGGLYGVSLGGYFTVESQFSFVKDASKVNLFFSDQTTISLSFI